MLAAIPWIIIPIIAGIRLSRSRTLDQESATPPYQPPMVSIIVPARNEARNIEACIHAALKSEYPNFELIVVNDHSTDDTGTIARNIARTEGRLRVIDNPNLPDGWFGKQWACQNGANAAHGDILLFVDADTRIMPEAVTRSVNGMLREQADLFTALSQQEMHSFWERLVQPQVFFMLGLRYGGTNIINKSKHFEDKIANGQYLMIRTETYIEMNGHALVRSFVAEDLKLAQLYFKAGKKTAVVIGMNFIVTRMYTSLHELINGWRKNVYAGGQDAMPFGTVGRAIFPIVLPVPALFQLLPPLTLLATPLLPPTIVTWALIATLASLLWWIISHITTKHSPLYALCYPIGAAILLYILLSAISRGNTVSWKNRTYTQGTPI